ncbi:MAG TPA: Kazal-type serine protease inhibitor [Pseudolabrys sp.]|jgi:hypothetical protein|nr:Kazal-type serine protease inhibitor [Pseudolabrys sp.]
MTIKTIGIAAVVAVAAAGFVLGTSAANAATMCDMSWKPVCANDHGFTHTFSNACWAKMSGAKILYNGECGMKPKAKHHHKKMAKPAAKKEMKKDEKKK